MLSELIGAFKDLATLIGLPMFTVLIGFFILIIEIFFFGALILFELWKIRGKMIELDSKTSLLVQSLQTEFKTEPETEPEFEPEDEHPNKHEKEVENEPKNTKYGYKWK